MADNIIMTELQEQSNVGVGALAPPGPLCENVVIVHRPPEI